MDRVGTHLVVDTVRLADELDGIGVHKGKARIRYDF